MQGESVWLKGMRAPVRTAMVVSTVAAALIYIWLVGNAILFEDAYGMHEMIRPQGRPLVWAMLISLFCSFFFASVYLSDFRGAIESEADGFFDILSLVTSRMAMLMIAALVFVMIYEVISRYVFGRGTLWANEMTWWIGAFVFLFAGQYAMQQRSHIRIYVIYDIMPRWAQKTADTLSVFMIVAFTFAMVWGNFADAQRRFLRMETLGTAWDPPIPGIVKPVVLIIVTLVAIQAVSNLIADWNKSPEHHSPLDEIDQTEIDNIRQTLEK